MKESPHRTSNPLRASWVAALVLSHAGVRCQFAFVSLDFALEGAPSCTNVTGIWHSRETCLSCTWVKGFYELENRGEGDECWGGEYPEKAALPLMVNPHKYRSKFWGTHESQQGRLKPATADAKRTELRCEPVIQVHVCRTHEKQHCPELRGDQHYCPQEAVTPKAWSSSTKAATVTTAWQQDPKCTQGTVPSAQCPANQHHATDSTQKSTSRWLAHIL